MQKNRYIELNTNRLKRLPNFASDYYLSKQALNFSEATLYQYLEILEMFLNWTIESGISKADKPKEVKLSELEKLTTKDIEVYMTQLRHSPKKTAHGFIADGNQSVSNKTVVDRIVSLKAIFRYLNEENNSDSGLPYLKNTALTRVRLPKQKSETLNYRADQLRKRMFLGKEKGQFIDWLKDEYPKKLTPQQLAFFNKNKERDLAIISLLMASGIRVSELTNANVGDCNLNGHEIQVIRKGNYKDIASIAPWAIPYLQDYLKIREKRYTPDSNNKALFLSNSRNKTMRITTISVDRLVKKYSTAFGRPTTPHKFRHSLATELIQKTGSETLVASILGQTTTSATRLYTHITANERKNIMESMQ
ncbi:tyrosine recombinase XerS [Oenococcus alcoholitolerans]|uniref:tyrosine recombinase XerS n=1 Tax=Oenococcus alcoholitolerans TaxID=931074 RepID=UPI003F72EB22